MVIRAIQKDKVCKAEAALETQLRKLVEFGPDYQSLINGKHPTEQRYE